MGMNAVQGFLIDLDGVMYVGTRPVDGAQEAIRFLEENGYPYRFVSNTTRKSRCTISAKLAEMGLDIPEKSIFTPPLAAVSYMNSSGRANGAFRCYLLTTGDADRDFDPARIGGRGDKVDFVVIGDAGDRITYDSLNEAFRHLLAGAELIALEKDRYWMAADGLALSAGPFVSALEYATGTTATVVGKPSEAFFRMALDDMGIPPEKAAMIGDDILTDIAGSQAIGMQGILVRTGKFSGKVLRDAHIHPSRIIGSIGDLPLLMGKGPA
jgi:HAD superfamily hydrolase (TIGR01458 family)